MKGANFSFFDIPTRILPWPFSRRVDLVYQNLGNWSTLYYNVSNYTFVAPVLGLLAYDSSTRSPHYDLIELNLMGDNPIVVRFPNVSLSVGMKCVRFSTNGTVQLSNVTGNNSCMARGHGHFSIVVPSRPSDEMTKERVWKWWVIGFAGGIVGLILLLVVVIMVYKLIKGGKIKKMERQSERNEVLDTIWIGRSRMPSASGIRTQPELESGGKIKKMERQSERNEVLDTIWIGRSRMPSASGIRTQPELESSYIP
ncbi:uncharacterized protein LOC111380110 [Olea europaea var. sylvestris]|uniref:uncharacterized protein LOC111380110 n=1 Tax=Olea europaea var. sylvestris TaxID=158386 RepID=UPI000C1D0881|nr:uncharacterized protein LOC111380110 [Olea europaea var. sylvestris]